MRRFYLTADQIEEFRANGVLVVRSFYDLDADIEPVQRGVHEVIGQVMARHGVTDVRCDYRRENFDDGFLDLIRGRRAVGGEVYDAVKQIPAFLRLVAHPSHEDLVRQLRHGAVPGVAAGGYGIRIDIPFEDKYRAYWHQEYPAQLRSLDGLVYWSPLVPVTREMGPVEFCPGSHKLGLLPVVNAAADSSGRSGAYALKLRDEEKLIDRYEKIAPLSSPGDLVIIDFLTLHASGYNRGLRARWSMQFRYFNFSESTGRAHGWKGSYAAGVDFRSVHPELDMQRDVRSK
jgi:hypothetical protein